MPMTSHRLTGGAIGAIDARIAKEQARQRSAQAPTRSNSGSQRPGARNASPAIRAARAKQPETKDGEVPERGPDPKEFEPEFVIGDDDLPSRVGTPRPVGDETKPSIPGDDQTNDADTTTEKQPEKAAEGHEMPAAPTELPKDVQGKLRRLEKIELRYQELLKSYRIAHARVIAIEPFEKALRENTPLTSTIDADALVEYLSQVNLKGEMVTDELKRVSRERDTFKQKLDEAEKGAREAWDTVAGLRAEKESDATAVEHEAKELGSESTTEVSPENQEPKSPSNTKSPISPSKPRHSSIQSISLFSPKVKAETDAEPEKESEEFFSYDNEIPRLENELQERQVEVDTLKSEVEGLKKDLGVAHESTQNMVKTLEDTTRQLNELKDQKTKLDSDLATKETESNVTIKRLELEVEQTRAKIQAASEREAQTAAKLVDTDTQFKEVQQLSQSLKAMNDELEGEKVSSQKRTETLNGLVNTLKEQISTGEVKVKRLQTQLNGRDVESKQLQERIINLERDKAKVSEGPVNSTIERPQLTTTTSEATPKEDIKNLPETTAPSKKKNKKKKKGGKPSNTIEDGATPETHQEADTSRAANSPVQQSVPDQSETVTGLQTELSRLQNLIDEKDEALARLRSKLENEEDLREEIETLRDDLLHIGDEHVQAKDKIKELSAEKAALATSTAGLEEEIAKLRAEQISEETKKAQSDLVSQFEDLAVKAAELQTNLDLAQDQASSRQRELSDLESVWQKAQPEMTGLRQEVGTLILAKEDLTKRVNDLQRIEGRHETVRTELIEMRKRATAAELEVRSLTESLSQEKSKVLQTEESNERIRKDLWTSDESKRESQQMLEKLNKDLVKSQSEFRNYQSRIIQLEGSVEKLNGDITNLQGEIELKTAQYMSAESLMSSMRDQSTELALQAKEARERCDSLEEEVADAHRLLSERSREGDTMRRLLADVEGRADSRLREMKERMDTAVEERDRAEDEASTQARRRSRELEELKNNLRDAERNLKRAEGDQDDLEAAQRDWKRRREELETRSEQSNREMQEVKDAMGQLRDALDESERQVRELEKQKAELRRSVEETQHRLDKLQRANKTMADEMKSIQTTKTKAMDSTRTSPRSSLDSGPSRTKVGSPAPRSQNGISKADQANGQALAGADYIYLKNVLLQFLEQKDKKHQMQLIPVLGMLLHFDRKDEQKWMSAITAR